MKALVVLATGLGKTITSALIAKKLKARRVLFLVHNNFILDNAMKEFRKVFGESMNSALYNGISQDGAQEAEFVFASFQTMGGHLADWNPDHFDLIIVDESHHSQAETYRKVIEYFNARKLGITATPDRRDLLDIRKIFGEEVINVTLEEAIAKGWLPRIEYHVVTDDGFDDEVLQQISSEVLQENKRITLEELNRRVFVKARDKKIADIIHGYDEKTLVFCRNINHADHFQTYLKLSRTFHSANGRTTNESWKKNQQVLEDLRNGLLLRVLAVNAFNEGVDVPSIGLVVFLRTTDSETIFRQQLGRGCRPGKEKLVVLDFVGNVQRIMMLKALADTIARIHEENTTSGSRDKEGYDHTLFHLSGKGFEFTFSDKIVDLMKIINRVQVDFYSTWQEASEATKKLGIKSWDDYKVGYKTDFRLPSHPRKVYSDFPGMSIFLGHNRYLNAKTVKYSTWQEASKQAEKLGLKNSFGYSKGYIVDPKLPSSPPDYYTNLSGWAEFFGKPFDFYPTWQKAAAICKKRGIRNRKEYSKVYKSDKRLPGSPESFYKNFPGWDSFLGKRVWNPYLTWQEAVKAALKLGIKTPAEYNEKYKKDAQLPRSLYAQYKDFPGWKKIKR